MKKWVITALVVVVLALLGWTAPRWAPPVLGFITDNTDLIQGLTDAVQLLLWIGGAVLAGFGVWQGRKQQPVSVAGASSSNSAQLTGSGGLAQGPGATAVGAGGVAGQTFRGPVAVFNVEKLEIGVRRRALEDPGTEAAAGGSHAGHRPISGASRRPLPLPRVQGHGGDGQGGLAPAPD